VETYPATGISVDGWHSGIDQRLCAARGFTLLEIMVALAIISVALVSLLALGNRSITTHARLQQMTQATCWHSRNWRRPRSTPASAASNRFARRGVPEPYAAYRWRLEFADTPLPSIRTVTVTVAWGEEDRNEFVDLTSFLF